MQYSAAGGQFEIVLSSRVAIRPIRRTTLQIDMVTKGSFIMNRTVSTVEPRRNSSRLEYSTSHFGMFAARLISGNLNGGTGLGLNTIKPLDQAIHPTKILQKQANHGKC